MQEQGELFGSPKLTEQRENLNRVCGKIGPLVLEFCRRVGVGGEFRAVRLHNFVGDSVAPASADRILRELRRAGQVDYVIVNRRQSLYRITGVEVMNAKAEPIREGEIEEPKGKVTALAKRRTAEPVESDTARVIQAILEVASSEKLNLPAVDKLNDLRLALKDEEGLRRFNSAMNAAQAELLPIATDSANPQTRSKYASYAALDRVARPIYTKHGFGLSFDTEPSPTPDHVLVVCYCSHGDYVRKYKLDMPADGKGARGGDVMTKTHAAGSAMTYGRRYLLALIFNLVVGADDDGNAAGGEVKFIKPDDAEIVRKLVLEVGKYEEDFLQKFLDWKKVESISDMLADDFASAKSGLENRLKKHKEGKR